MIPIYRASGYDSKINHFYGKDFVQRNEVILKTKVVFGEEYVYAEPAKTGQWAFGGTMLFTSNGVFPEFNKPIKLHDRDMSLER